MTEEDKEKKEAKKKPQRRRGKGAGNVEPAEEPDRGPSGEDIFRVK
jgi:hypothetical protein